MKDFLGGLRLLALDLASTLFFLVMLLVTHNAAISAGLAMALGIARIVAQLVRRKPVGAIGWLSLGLVIVIGTTTAITGDAHLMLFKPSVLYAVIGAVMLKPGWMNRYMPAIARTVAPDVGAAMGYVWAGVMFVSAVVNAVVALACSVTTWALVMPIFGIAIKIAAFALVFGVIRAVAVRRIMAMPAAERDALLAASGRKPPSASPAAAASRSKPLRSAPPSRA